MNKLQMPHSYAALSEAEQTGISGGGPLGDALNGSRRGLYILGGESGDGSLLCYSPPS